MHMFVVQKFCWVIVMASAWELGSFVTRALGARDQQSSGLSLVSQLLVLLAPLCKSDIFSLECAPSITIRVVANE